MIHSVKKITLLNESINNFFIAFKDDIISKTELQWKEEDYKGNSFVQWKIMKYYYILHLMILIFLEKERNKDTYGWSYYVDKFDLDIFKKCLACDNISIEKAYTAFGFISSSEEGVEFQEIEVDNIVGNSLYPVSDIKIKDLLNNSICINYINN